MPTGWESHEVSHVGGLQTNLAPLQQGTQKPGTAITLINFEPSIHGGYRRIEGFAKYDDDIVPPYGEPLIQGSGQTGTTLVVGNLLSSPVPGDTLTIAGVSGTYTVANLGVTYTASTSSASFTLTTSLDSSPADKAVVTFTNATTPIQALKFYEEHQYVVRGGIMWKGNGTGWTNITIPTYGTVLVDGGSQTGTTLVVDGLDDTPRAGDTFSIDGVELVYTVQADATVLSGGASVTILPALDSSPADNAAITFLGINRNTGGRHRHATYDFSGQVSFASVDGTNAPIVYNNTSLEVLADAPADVIGSSHVIEFKNHLFFGKGSTITFSAPYAYNDFTAASGGGVINFAHNVTGMIVFREQLIVFSTNTIHRIVGNSVGDFQVQPISKDIGCIKEDTIQELGGDVLFMGPDGLRMLSATERIGDFGFAVASRAIQKEMVSFMNTYDSFSSIVIREKNQYRVFGYKSSYQASVTKGIIGVQFADQDGTSLAWAETKGIRAYVSQSVFCPCLQQEVITFAHTDGYVYQLENVDTFDGEAISASFHTPYWPVTDPRVRKTWYKLHTYADPEGFIEGQVNLNFDFDKANVIQPATIAITGGSGTASFWGSMVWGTGTWGGVVESLYTNQTVGTSFVVSLQYEFNSVCPPFSIDSSLLEYGTAGRQ